MTTFIESSKDNKIFIQSVAKHETGIKFTLEELDVLLGSETEEFIVDPLNSYHSAGSKSLDSYDKYVIFTLIWEQILGRRFDQMSKNVLANHIEKHSDWINNLYSRQELFEHTQARKEVVHNLAITTGKFPDYVLITSSEKYAQVIADFLIEHKDEIKKTS
jgi:adenine-specific DNA methylase